MASEASSSASAAAASSSGSSSSRVSVIPAADIPRRGLQIKKESPEDEIKEYAETAMNELLGWYGYDKLDSRDTQGLDLHHFASVSKHARRHLTGKMANNHASSRPPPPPSEPSSSSPFPAPRMPPPAIARHTVKTTLTKLPLPSMPPPSPCAVLSSPVAPSRAQVDQQSDTDASSSSSSAGGAGVAGAAVDSPPPPPLVRVKVERPDTPPSTNVAPEPFRADSPMDSMAASSAVVVQSTSTSDPKYASSSSGSPQSPEVNCAEQPLLCSWCGRPAGNLPITAPSTTTTVSVRNGGSSSVTSTTTKSFCSEVCFTQCRRASFKRSKACDWCRHVRHTVAYVDFQDGETQLQFCSDKCLNQYKMNIFCKETQAHLAQLKAEASANGSLTGGSNNSGPGVGPPLIITPDLWLRDCNDAGTVMDRGDEDASETIDPGEVSGGDSHGEEDAGGDENNEDRPTATTAIEEASAEESTEEALRRTTSSSMPKGALFSEGAPSHRGPERRPTPSKERRRRKRRRQSEDTAISPAPVPLFPPMRPPPALQPPHPGLQGPRNTPPPLPGLVSGSLPPPPFMGPPHLPPPHIPLHLLPPLPEAQFSRFLHPPRTGDSMPPPLPIPHSPLQGHHPPPHPPRVPPLHLPHPHHQQPPPSLLPPVTMLVPYPIILPIPVPIPIPIPILGDALLRRLAEEKRKKEGEEEDKERGSPPGIAQPATSATPPPSSPPPALSPPSTPHKTTARDKSLPSRKRSKGGGGSSVISTAEEDGAVVGSKRKFVPV